MVYNFLRDHPEHAGCSQGLGVAGLCLLKPAGLGPLFEGAPGVGVHAPGVGGYTVVEGVLDPAPVLVGEAGGHGGQEALGMGLGTRCRGILQGNFCPRAKRVLYAKKVEPNFSVYFYVGVGPEVTTMQPALEQFPLEERILVVLAQQPWASAPDLAQRPDLPSDIRETCNQLEEDKMIAGRDIVVTHRKQRRYVLTRQGVMHVTKPFHHNGLLRAALPLTWQMTEDGVTRMLLWLPMIKCLYEILPAFWTSGIAEPFQWQSPHPDPACSSYVWLGRPTLTDVRWLPSGRLHAAATWRFERDDKRPRYYALPFFWAGLLPQEDYRSRSLRLGPFIRCLHGPEDPIRWDIEPPLVAIGLDQFAAFRSRTAYGDDVQVGAVDTVGALVWSAEASHSEWTPGDRPPQARSIGHPEAAAIGEGPDLVNLGGVREYRLFCFLSDFRAATKENMRKAFRMSGSSVTTALNADDPPSDNRSVSQEDMILRVRETANAALSNALYDLYAVDVEQRLNQYRIDALDGVRKEMDDRWIKRETIWSVLLSSWWQKVLAAIIFFSTVTAGVGAIVYVIQFLGNKLSG